MPNCETCKEKKEPLTVPYVVHEAEMARSERHIKRLWILVIIAWVITFLIVGIFTYERLQYDYSGTYEEINVEQDAQDGGDTNYIWNDGDIVNGLPESESSSENANPQAKIRHFQRNES